MNMIKKVGLTAALALTSSFASAATLNLENLTNATVTDNVASVAVGAFSSVFDFTIDVDSVFNAYATGTPASISAFTGIFLSNGLAGSTGFSPPIDSPYAGIFDQTLSAGTYTLTVEGLGLAGNSGYTLEASAFSVSPVPEPSSIALMLGGLGLVGFMAARRKKA
ncbi:MAG: FxDxF family PEP-CTERM protein [Thiomicrorhabdus sp.]|nr:FxDxF family PEP-CTERM protein [Thiomicrorhabdus sp.]